MTAKEIGCAVDSTRLHSAQVPKLFDAFSIDEGFLLGVASLQQPSSLETKTSDAPTSIEASVAHKPGTNDLADETA